MVTYPREDIEIVPLSPIHRSIIESFGCIIKDLEDFIKDDALVQQEEAVNFTYLWVSKKDNVLLSYITLCNDAIHLKGQKKEEMRKIGICYKTLPALKICRMAVHRNFTRQHIGTLMIAFAINLALNTNDRVGCRFLTLEAKNVHDLEESQKPIHFYKQNSFEILKERKPDPSYIPMYKDLKPMINERRKSKFGIA